MKNLGDVLAIALIPFIGALLGGGIASFLNLRGKLLSIIQHFVAGVVVAAVSVELLPKILHTGAYLGVGLGFLFGAALMLSLHEITHFLAKKKAQGFPTGLFVGSVIDLFIDGILIGISFIAGKASGLLIAISLTLCAFFLNAAIASELKARKASLIARWVCFSIVAIALFLGVIVGYVVILHLFKDVLVETLAFGVAALLYLGIEELLVEAHEEHDTALTSAPFFIGFLLILFFRM